MTRETGIFGVLHTGAFASTILVGVAGGTMSAAGLITMSEDVAVATGAGVVLLVLKL